MNKLYVLQYDDKAYCVPFCGEIFTNKKSLLEYVRNNDTSGLRYLSIYEYDNDIKGYQESTNMYYLNKKQYNKNARYYWKDYEDKTFIHNATYHDIINKIRSNTNDR